MLDQKAKAMAALEAERVREVEAREARLEALRDMVRMHVQVGRDAGRATGHTEASEPAPIRVLFLFFWIVFSR
jgi:hypothetical protein